MYVFTGNFGTSLVPQQLGITDTQVKKIEFFPVKSWSTTGTLLTNTAPYYVGLETGALPYIVPTGSNLTIDYGQHGTFEKVKNFFVKGVQDDGFYVIVHP